MFSLFDLIGYVHSLRSRIFVGFRILLYPRFPAMGSLFRCLYLHTCFFRQTFLFIIFYQTLLFGRNISENFIVLENSNQIMTLNRCWAHNLCCYVTSFGTWLRTLFLKNYFYTMGTVSWKSSPSLIPGLELHLVVITWRSNKNSFKQLNIHIFALITSFSPRLSTCCFYGNV